MMRTAAFELALGEILAKLNVGCGNDIRPGWVNHDVAALPGVDVVHDLETFPWPFEDNQFDEIELINVLEHLSDTIRTLEELHRISKPGGAVTIRVPFWNSPDMYTDPTHKAFFSAKTWGFFDPTDYHCIDRPYYSTARFLIRDRVFWIKPVKYYVPVKIKPIQRILVHISNHVSGVIWVQQVKLETVKK